MNCFTKYISKYELTIRGTIGKTIAAIQNLLVKLVVIIHKHAVEVELICRHNIEIRHPLIPANRKMLLPKCALVP